MRNAAIGDDTVDGEDISEEKREDTSVGELLSEEERDLLVKRLAACGLPTREIIWITGTSGRTVARIMQRWGITRKKLEGLRIIKKGLAHSLPEILRQYYEMKEVSLDSLITLATEKSLSLKGLLNLLRVNIAPSRWAIRPCLGSCGQFSLTPSPADRYCPTCKKKIKKARKTIDDEGIYN